MPRLLLPLFLLLFASHLGAQQSLPVKITTLDQRLKNGGDTTFIVNFWATWCGPCVKELPYFAHTDSLFRDKKSKLILVSLDDVSDTLKVKKFLERKKISAAGYILDETNADYWIPFIDKDWQGAIPVTLFINSASNYRMFFGRAMTEEELKSEWKKSLGE